MSYEEAISVASKDERFRATVYAMNTLLIHKGIYSKEEFQRLFVEWLQKELRSESSAGAPATASRAHAD
jgi:hypothetical protein